MRVRASFEVVGKNELLVPPALYYAYYTHTHNTNILYTIAGAVLRAGNAYKMKGATVVAVPFDRQREFRRSTCAGAVALGGVFRAAVCRVNGSSSSSCALGAIQSCAYCPMSIGLSVGRWLSKSATHTQPVLVSP